MNALEKNGSPKPLFETGEERLYFATTLYIHPDFLPSKKVRVDGNDGNSDGNLSQNEKRVLDIIMQEPALSASKVSGKAGISKPTVERCLKKLKDKGYIKREGATRGKWIIL